MLILGLWFLLMLRFHVELRVFVGGHGSNLSDPCWPKEIQSPVVLLNMSICSCLECFVTSCHFVILFQFLI